MGCAAQSHRLAFDGLPCRVAGLVPLEAYQAACEQHLQRAALLRNARFMNLALLAAAEALQVRPRWLQGSDNEVERHGRAASQST